MPAKTVTVLITGDSKQLQRSLKEAALASEESSLAIGSSMDKASTRAGSAMERLGQKITALGIPGGEAFGKIGSHIEKADTKGQRFMQTVSTIGGTALTAGVAGFVAIGAASVEMADKNEIAMNQLDASLKTNGDSVKNHKGQIEEMTSSMAKYGFTQTDVAEAMKTGVISSGNFTTAMSRVPVAMELAKAKNIDLGTAMSTVDKAANGQTRALKMLGIDLPIAAGGALKVEKANTALHKAQEAVNAILAKSPDAANPASKAHDAYAKAVAKTESAQKKLTDTQNSGNQILDALSQRLAGQATAASETLQGQTQALKAEVTDLAIKFGDWLMPKLKATVEAIKHAVEWFQKHKGVAEALGIAIGVVLGGAITVFVVNKIASLISATGRAMASIGKLGAKFMGTAAETTVAGTEMTVATEGMTVATEEAAVGIDAAIGSTGVGLILIGLGLAAMLLFTHWKTVWGWIKAIIHDAVSWIKSHLDLVLGLMGPLGWAILLLKDNWNTVWGAVKTAVSGAWSFIRPIFDAIKSAIHDVMGAISSVTGAISSVAHVGGSIVGGAAHLLGFDEGGMVPGTAGAPMHAIVHGGEYVLPQAVVKAITTGRKVTAADMAGPGGGVAGHSNGGSGQTINVYASTNATARSIAHEVGWAMRTAPTGA